MTGLTKIVRIMHRTMGKQNNVLYRLSLRPQDLNNSFYKIEMINLLDCSFI